MMTSFAEKAATFVFGTMTGAIAGLASAYFAYGSTYIAENSYFMTLDNSRKIALQIDEPELRKSELERIEKIAQWGYRDFFLDAIKSDLVIAAQDIAQLQAAKNEQERIAVAEKQRLEKEAAQQKANAENEKRLQAMQRAFPDERICLNSSCSNYVIR
jgi:hypothetical protein